MLLRYFFIYMLYSIINKKIGPKFFAKVNFLFNWYLKNKIFLFSEDEEFNRFILFYFSNKEKVINIALNSITKEILELK